MTVSSFLDNSGGAMSLPAISFALLVLSLPTYALYRSFFDPLSGIPGPLICRLTNLWAWYHSYIGDESQQIDALHKRYGPVVRIGPHDVAIGEGQALAPIYSERGGFLKAPCYANFDSEGHETIFSTLDPKHRGIRSKAVIPLFSTGSIRNGSQTIEACANGFVDRLKTEADRGRKLAKQSGKPYPVNVLNLARGLAIDAVSSYLFGKDYGGIREQTTKLSASSYVDSVVAFGRFFFLPNWLFLPILMALTRVQSTKEGDESASKVNSFTSPLVDESPQDDSTYQSRLLKAGISAHETDVQMKDVIFAGTDTTGTNFGSLVWQLAKHPEVYRKLREEIASAEEEDPNYDPQNLKYLHAVIREGLRTSMANPTRFPRQVPPSGWTYTANNGKEFHLPSGTVVGIAPYSLHFNPDVFPEPRAFKPERWIEDPTPEMYRDWFPFGIGPRMCIARNLAMAEMVYATRAVARSNVLEGAKPAKEKIEMYEWFNGKVKGETIDLVWE